MFSRHPAVSRGLFTDRLRTSPVIHESTAHNPNSCGLFEMFFFLTWSSMRFNFVLWWSYQMYFFFFSTFEYSSVLFTKPKKAVDRGETRNRKYWVLACLKIYIRSPAMSRSPEHDPFHGIHAPFEFFSVTLRCTEILNQFQVSAYFVKKVVLQFVIFTTHEIYLQNFYRPTSREACTWLHIFYLCICTNIYRNY